MIALNPSRTNMRPVVELADTRALGTRAKSVQVQILSGRPVK